MQLAARKGYLAMLNLLLRHGGNLNSRGVTGDSLAHLAAQHGAVAVLRWLTEKGVSPATVLDSVGQSPVHVAAIYCQLEALKYLLSVGADVFLRDSFGKTALDCVPEDKSHNAFVTRLLLSKSLKSK